MKPKDEQRHQRLLDAGTALLAREGLANFSTTKVAKLAGVPQSNIYIYFDNKQDLLEAVYLENVHQQSVAVAQALKPADDLETQLRASIGALYQFALTHAEATRVVQALTAEPQFKQDPLVKLADPANHQIQTLLKDSVDQGVLRNTNLNLLRYFLTDPVYRYAEMVRDGQIPDSTAGVRELTVMVMAAVKAA